MISVIATMDEAGNRILLRVDIICPILKRLPSYK
jgi:hypothetical protein